MIKFSVVTIVYNDFHHIESTLKSVLEQSGREAIEYLVIDGASSDGTSEIIKKYINDIDIYICEPDSGIYNAMNKGITNATGDYILFINSGDGLIDREVINKLLIAINESKPDVIYGSYRERADNQSNIIHCRNANKIWYGPVTAHQSTLYRLDHLRKLCLKYDETYRIAADYKLTAQAIKTANEILKTDICISYFDTTGVSSNNQNLGLKEANRVRREVFGWNKMQIFGLTTILLCARYTKRFARPLYNLLRH